MAPPPSIPIALAISYVGSPWQSCKWLTGALPCSHAAPGPAGQAPLLRWLSPRKRAAARFMARAHAASLLPVAGPLAASRQSTAAPSTEVHNVAEQKLRTSGHVSVRVIPSTVCILPMTIWPRSSTLAASVSAMTS